MLISAIIFFCCFLIIHSEAFFLPFLDGPNLWPYNAKGNVTFDTDLSKWMTDALDALTGNRSHLNHSGFESVPCPANLCFIINILNINFSEYKDKNQT